MCLGLGAAPKRLGLRIRPEAEPERARCDLPLALCGSCQRINHRRVPHAIACTPPITREGCLSVRCPTRPRLLMVSQQCRKGARVSLALGGAMSRYHFRCPVTGSEVRGFLVEEAPIHDPDSYTPVCCLVCRQMHWVNFKTGDAIGEGQGLGVYTDMISTGRAN